MNKGTSQQQQPPMPLPEGMRHRLTDRVLTNDDGAIRIVAASVQNWPELTPLGVGEIALGNDGLIRLALRSASTCCATLLATRRATLLLPEEDGAGQIRCLVLANANLATRRPLSGFLLKPFEIVDGHRFTGAHHSPARPWTPEDDLNRASETRLALLDAFPVEDDRENPLPEGTPPP